MAHTLHGFNTILAPLLVKYAQLPIVYIFSQIVYLQFLILVQYDRSRMIWVGTNFVTPVSEYRRIFTYSTTERRKSET